ncbi:U1 small nuclear ribonucleoprotein 70 kDa-like [Macadamia integrifolia]|uniref:U1 small nuclear ribonucleoprotein 70 kDa-like n=1 Tax=Macadamia integrifolia TaxID=60698 RepID=UPI001C533B1A|nr:U1 small nuclear ribonucleoprotein 70 kDa-like [Macadamia integrifolia]XP_042519859.1 U1 small nuclear ribonucleoprotein 70 kDa-like [Macadamia integrifolia]
MGDMNDPFMRNRDAAVQARTKAQNRATVLQLKLIGQSHPTGLTNNLLKLFEPRPPLEYKPPPEKRKCPPYMGMAQFVSNFAEPGDPEYAPPVKLGETPVERRARIHKLRLEQGAAKAAEELEKYDPASDPNVSGDPYKTLFVARLNYETTEHRLKREFEAYGPIKRVRMITDKETNKPRGYAFIEYMHTRDMKAAYKQADGRKLDNRRVLVDVERGRTVPNWRPRRLGGGLGSTRVGGEEVNQKYSGREPQQIASGGAPRSEEPRSREDRHVDREREKSRERGRDRDWEREKSRERSNDRTRDRDPREERHNRDRDRTRDRDRERERGRDRDRRDRDRGRDHERDRDRDRDRERDRDRGRDRPRERERDHDRGDSEQDRGRSRDKESDYDRIEPKHEREKERDYGHKESENDRGWNDHAEPGHGYGRMEAADREHGHYDHFEDQGRGGYDHFEPQDDQRLSDHDPDRYDQMEPEEYRYDQGDKIRDREREYDRSERSVSRE